MPAAGACTGAEIAGYVAGCLTGGSQAACTAWFNSATMACGVCIAPAMQAADGALVPTNTGAIVYDYNSNNIGPNYPGCIAIKDTTGGTACAQAYWAFYQCLDATGCLLTCTTTAAFQTCEQTVATGSGACASKYTAQQTACAADFADGGVGNGGVCSNDTEVLSVICGNGSGDGG